MATPACGSFSSTPDWPFQPREEPAEQKRVADAVTRAAEVSRLIARQSDPRSVLVTAVNQIGARWHYSRCLAALATPGKPPSLVVEYCSPEVPKSERTAMVRLLALSQRLTSVEPVFRAADVQLSEAARADSSGARPTERALASGARAAQRGSAHRIVHRAAVRSTPPLVVRRSCAAALDGGPGCARRAGSTLAPLVSTLGVAEEEHRAAEALLLHRCRSRRTGPSTRAEERSAVRWR